MKILKISTKNFNKLVKEAARFIKEGKIIICPTDTVYGLIADAKNEKAVRRIFKIKKREIKKPLPIFVKDFKMAQKIVKTDERKMAFLRKIWPGKVTAILKAKNKKLSKGIIKDGKIGLRIQKHKFLVKLLKILNRPLAQTSANISGNPTPIDIKGILNQFKNKKFQPDFIIDSGKLSKKPSIVLDLTEESPKILRK